MKNFSLKKVGVFFSLSLSAGLFVFSTSAMAAPVVSQFTGWTMIATEDDDAFVAARGGQQFDAEHLFYQTSGTSITFGLQAGFDLVNGSQLFGTAGESIYAGDFALSFDGNDTSYEYAFEFGKYTEGYYGYSPKDTMPAVTVGLYENIVWSDQVLQGPDPSDPFSFSHYAMKSGNLLVNGTTDAGAEGGVYWKTFQFDLADPALAGIYDPLNGISVQWTMSCGNDYINGNTNDPVPEPTTMLLFGSGLVGLVAFRKRKNSR